VKLGTPHRDARGEGLRAYLDAALDCVIVADASGRVVEFNPAAERTFGYTRDEALGRTLAELVVPPSLRERHGDAFARFVETGEKRVFGRRLELTAIRADGTEFPVELALGEVSDQPLLISGAVRDLTDAKRAERHLRRLADEQEALRRVATLVAGGAAGDVIFASVAEEIARLLMADRCAIGRFEADDSMTVVAYWSNEELKLPVGTRIGLQGDGVTAAVRESRRPILIDDHEAFSGPLIDYARTLGELPRATVAAPIFVEGRVWGTIFASTMAVEIAEGTESRVVDFAELVATAIANTEARRELERVAAEQLALRKAAMLVASGASPSEVFAAITASAAELFEVPFASLLRYGPGETATMIAGCAACSGFVGQKWTVPDDDPGIVRTVVDSRRPARIEDHSGVHGPLGEAASSLGIGSVVGVPVIVDGSVWGVLAVGAAQDGPPLPADASDRLVGFTGLVTTTLINAETRDSLRSLVDEQAALRRVATLVAAGVQPDELFSAVSEEVARLFAADGAGIGRYEPDGSGVVAVGRSESLSTIPVGSRQDLDKAIIAGEVYRTGRPTRRDLSREDVGDAGGLGELAQRVLALGFVSTVAAPIVVEGELWGLVTASSTRTHATLPPDTEKRLESFCELVATAIANAESRAELAASEARARALANEQAALRRVATLVAEQQSAHEIFTAVTEAVGPLLGADIAAMHMFPGDGTLTTIAGWSADGDMVPIGTRLRLDGDGLADRVFHSGAAVRIDSYTGVEGETADVARGLRLRSAVGAPILVGGALWGVLMAATRSAKPLPDDAERRIAAFTELVATAIANTEARSELERLAAEQAALRRVATLVAAGVEPAELFSTVSSEIARLFTADWAAVGRYEPDGSGAVLVGASEDLPGLPVGTRSGLDKGIVAGQIYRSGRPARNDDVGATRATADATQQFAALGFISTVGAPITVDGELWGYVAASSSHSSLPPSTEKRIQSFGELLATAIANAHTRGELAASEGRARTLASEQAALRRVATLVARGASPDETFSAVAQEVAGITGIPVVGVNRYEADGTFTVLGVAGETNFTVGSRWPIEEEGVAGMIHASGRPSRMDDSATVPGKLGEAVRLDGLVSTLAVPIVVEGSIWGFLIAATKRRKPIPAGTEERLATFTELVATAVSNATTRSELIASRARIVAAGDEARRRMERNLHDGTQQRLIALGLDVETLRDSLPAEQQGAQAGLQRIRQELEAVLADVRELSHGLHPPLLSQRGLAGSLRALARRSPIPVRLDVDVSERPSESTETAIYYAISEALANAAKHARASDVSVLVATSGGEIRAIIEDNGSGGAEVSAGSGLVGLVDRIEALGGRFALDSRPGHGTRISIEMPLATEPIGGDVPRPSVPPGTLELAQPVDAGMLHAAILASADALYVVDTRGRIRFLNRAALRILGYDDERQLLGRPSHDTIHYLRPDGTAFPAAECPLLRPRLSGETVRVDNDWFVRQDGSLVAVAYASAPVPLHDGRGAVVSFREPAGSPIAQPQERDE
jgi:PAS domain S-box-containing protein